MDNEVTRALEIIREMPISKMITLKFITKEQIDFINSRGGNRTMSTEY